VGNRNLPVAESRRALDALFFAPRTKGKKVFDFELPLRGKDFASLISSALGGAESRFSRKAQSKFKILKGLWCAQRKRVIGQSLRDPKPAY
jgi:hypothetical protein